MGNSCPSEIQYGSPEQLSELSAKWATVPNDAKKMATDAFNIDLDTIRVFEKQPTLPYKFPYSFTNSAPAVDCDKFPTLPAEVTLPMVKTQLNKRAQIMGLTIPFPDDEKKKDYNYTMLYIILLLIVVVVVAVIYAMSQPSMPAGQTNPNSPYYY